MEEINMKVQKEDVIRIAIEDDRIKANIWVRSIVEK